MQQLLNLNHKNIIVTGASSGIGRETAVLLSQLGARLVLVARNQEQLEKTLTLLEGSDHHVIPFDLGAVDDIPRWMKEVAERTGPLSGLVHSAGVQFTQPLRATSSASMENMLRLNVTSALCLAKGYRQKGVCSTDGGSIVFLSSVMGLVGQAGQAAYSASKGALVALTKSLALELARERIRVNSVAPAVVKTEMTEKMFAGLTSEQISQIETMHPLGLGRPRDVAYAIAFLLAETSRWITGTTLVVDGGYTAH